MAKTTGNSAVSLDTAGFQYAVRIALREGAAPDVKDGEAVIMARPESLRILGEGEGKISGRVKLNVYLGSSIESFVDTPFGEVLVEIDDPFAKKIYSEGESVSIDFAPDRVRLLSKSEE